VTDAPSVGDGDSVTTNARGTFAMASPPPETVGQAAGATAGSSLCAAAGGTARAPRKPNLPGTHRLALEKEFVHQRLLGNGEYDHSAAAEDEHASLINAGASQRLPATNKAGPVTADQAARWALGAIRATVAECDSETVGSSVDEHDGGGSEGA